jgi:hypothetical protein
LIGVGVLPTHDQAAETLFKTLVEDNATNFRSPRTAAAVVALDTPAEIGWIFPELVKAVTR